MQPSTGSLLKVLSLQTSKIKIIEGTAHHMPLKLLFALHEIEAKLTKI